jgi:hypothetical protein
MARRLACNVDLDKSTVFGLLQSQEALPPYELDPMVDNPVVRKRIGEVIAKASNNSVFRQVAPNRRLGGR